MTGARRRCSSCRRNTIWNGSDWRNLGRQYQSAGIWFGRKHVCRPERPTCGVWMPTAKERCARGPGHGWEHRTAYAMDNARRAA